MAVIALVAGAGCGGEVCDDDADNDGDGFVDCDDAACGFFPGCGRCGDGVLDDEEACDDGGDGACDDRCGLKGCGDGSVGPGEACDDGNLVRGDGCNDRCEVDRCGDGVRQSEFEECDDANVSSGDGCTSRCKVERGALCGNFQIDIGEECDDGNRRGNDGCSPRCRPEFCGDGVRQPRLGEACDGDDLDEEGARCLGCQIDRCGNGRVDAGEVCDDGNFVDGDACTGCKPARCGNGILELDEDCDDANALANDGCAPDCTPEVCGDGVRQGNELCDPIDEEGDDGCVGCLPDGFDRDGVVIDVSRLGVAFDLQGITSGIALAGDDLFIAAPAHGVVFQFRGDVDGGFLQQVTNMTLANSPDVFAVDNDVVDDVLGCLNGQVILNLFNGGGLQTFFPGTPCSAVVAADFDGDGDGSVVTAASTGLFVQDDPPFAGFFGVDVPGGVDGNPQALVALDGVGGDVVVVAAADGALWQLDDAILSPLGARRGRLLVAADVDGDGDDDVVSAIDAVVDVGGVVTVDDVVGAKRLAKGDIDEDGRDDVVVIGGDTATLLLSTRAFAPLDPFAIPGQSSVVVAGNDLVVVGGRERLPLLYLRYSVAQR